MNDAMHMLRERVGEMQIVLERNACVFDLDEPTARDLVQQTWIVAFEKIGQAGEIRNLGAWLKTVQRNLIIDWLRKRRERTNLKYLDERFEDLMEPDSGPVEELMRQEVGQLVRESIEEMPPELKRFGMAACEVGIGDTEELMRLLSMSRDMVYRNRQRLGEWFREHKFDVFGDVRAMPVILTLVAWETQRRS
jgi:RNA polymerase sigma factor (sigma-70 family)